jgi:hypothetical protein
MLQIPQNKFALKSVKRFSKCYMRTDRQTDRQTWQDQFVWPKVRGYCDMILCSLIDFYRRFGGMYWLSLQGRRASQASNQQNARRVAHRTNTGLRSVWTRLWRRWQACLQCAPICLILQPWRWSQYLSLKLTKLYWIQIEYRRCRTTIRRAFHSHSAYLNAQPCALLQITVISFPENGYPTCPPRTAGLRTPKAWTFCHAQKFRTDHSAPRGSGAGVWGRSCTAHYYCY